MLQRDIYILDFFYFTFVLKFNKSRFACKNLLSLQKAAYSITIYPVLINTYSDERNFYIKRSHNLENLMIKLSL